MKKTYVQTDSGLVLVEKVRSAPVGPYIIGDIKPHRNMVTGEYVTSRSRHKSILREHGLEEVGNENLAKYTPARPQPTGVKESILQSLEKHK